ncbi:MAG: hypothetical protein WCK67_06910 [bacterium]
MSFEINNSVKLANTQNIKQIKPQQSGNVAKMTNDKLIKADSLEINYQKNQQNDIFLKDYLLKQITKSGVKVPSSINLDVCAPGVDDKKSKDEFAKVVFGPYHGFIDDFFELMAEEKPQFEQRVKNMKTDEGLKNSLTSIHNFLDNYYKLEITVSGSKKPYNLLHLTEEDKKELNTIAKPDEKAFIDEALKHTQDTKKLAAKFSRSEMERKTLSEAGEGSKDFIKTLIAGTAFTFLLDQNNEKIVDALSKKSTKLANLMNGSATLITGVGDDALASIKDYQQDKVTLGKPMARGILASSLALAYGAGSILDKYKEKMDSRTAAVIYSIVSSVGSIWSNICAFGIMQSKQKEMKESGLINPNDKQNSFAKTFKNYVAYDAYFGKIIGILACIPVAIIAQKAGLLKQKVVISESGEKTIKFVHNIGGSIALNLIGSGETLITSIVQAFRDTLRKASIDSAKTNVSNNPDKASTYNAREFNIEGVSKTSQTVDSLKLFTKYTLNDWKKSISNIGPSINSEIEKIKHFFNKKVTKKA